MARVHSIKSVGPGKRVHVVCAPEMGALNMSSPFNDQSWSDDKSNE